MTTNIFDVAIENKTIFDDPYPIYQILRDSNPVCWSELYQAWVITKYRDIEYGLKLAHVSARRHSIQTSLLSLDIREFLENFYYGWLMYQEPPNHTRIKKATGYIFTSTTLSNILSFTRAEANEIFNAYSKTKTLNITSGYGYPLALSSVCQLFGIQAENHALISKWSSYIVDFMQGRYTDYQSSSYNALEAAHNLVAFLDNLINEQLNNQSAIPSNFSDFLKTIEDGIISREEAISVMANILMDGYEPIANAIANSVLALEKHRKGLDEISRNPKILVTGVDEFLRYDPPFQYVVRNAINDFSINDTKIRKGQRILFMIASANRDPEVFSNPDSLELNRTNNYHKSFGFGHHHCLGAALARQVIYAALEVFIQQANNFTITSPNIERHQSLGSRAIKNLSIAW